MMRIGDFSKLCRVPVKTLRYYDEVGLLNPARVDEFTGYRYYTVNQLERINRILALKEFGFSLDEIAQMLRDDITLVELQGMLKLRRSEIRQAMQLEGDRLARVEARLKQMEMEHKMSDYEVLIKQIEPIKVASVRGVVPTPPEQGGLWNELETYLQKERVSPTGSCLSLYHDDEYKEQDWDIEVCEPIESRLKGTDQIKVYELPGVETMACTLHHGPFVTISQAYDAIMRWIGENGYQITGPAREVYLRSAENGSQEDPETLTEIQFPVQKT
ncbi:MAG: MerR family transcriptional regulator [Anaerolineales bacterium]|jgi:effector-binding domain-containing protein